MTTELTEQQIRRRAYHEAHKEEENAKCREWYQAHKEERAEYAKQYAATHKEESRTRNRERAERRKADGICTVCSNPAVPGKTLCVECIAWHNQYNDARRDERKEYWKARYAADPMRSRENALKYLFGITLADYDALFTKQNGCCAICGRHQDDFEKRLFVDHDHETGEVRGLLCATCNSGIGQFYDDEGLLRKAADYIANSLLAVPA